MAVPVITSITIWALIMHSFLSRRKDTGLVAIMWDRLPLFVANILILTPGLGRPMTGVIMALSIALMAVGTIWLGLREEL